MGRVCAVIGCSNSTFKLDEWYAQLCEIHGLHFGSCICKPPFQLFPFPTEARDPEARKRWIRLINRKTKEGQPWEPKYQDRVCSVHFLESEPTPSLPDPTEDLGFDALDGRIISKRKLPRDPSEESLPFREIITQIQEPVKRKRKQAVPCKDQEQEKREQTEEGSPEAVTGGMPENKEEHTETEPLSTSAREKHSGSSYCHPIDNQYECERCSEKETRVKELEEKVKELEHQLKVAKPKKVTRSSVHEGALSVLKSDSTRNPRVSKRGKRSSKSS